MNSREVYLMPGDSPAGGPSQGSVIVCRLDTGPSDQFPQRDLRKIEYGYSMTQYRWSKLEIRNPEFVQACPCSALPLGPSQMIIFGGKSLRSFTLDTSQASVAGSQPGRQNQANVQTATSLDSLFGGMQYSLQVG